MNEIKPDQSEVDNEALLRPDGNEQESALEAIAIIGMTGRFPGAENIESFWENICEGKESVEFYPIDELKKEGIPQTLLQDKNFVRASATIKHADTFDAAFFGFTPREARLMDPQHRVFLESAWHALEHAGIDPDHCRASIGVFAGTNLDNYQNAYINEKEFVSASPYEKRISSDSGFFATRVAYKLNLKGPAITIQTACSTSLVSISEACQHLMTYQCDVAIAGAATVQAPRKTGYLFQQHGISSPDGHCRPFDADAKGTIGGEGVATVVLKRLQDALDDADTIHAVIKGWALNNDGNAKVGFTAPSVDGQAEVIEMAQALAGVSADSIGYLEGHGTGTELGDPIEVAALTQAFNVTTNRQGYCALGSVKANIGHLDATAGIAGLIKTTLALKHQLIPPLANYIAPNPKINLSSSPFYINTRLENWKQGSTPRRAGVSSFGMGGTNAHIILQQSPQRTLIQKSSKPRLLLVSARNQQQCHQAIENLALWLEKHPDQLLSDVAYTLQRGRKRFSHMAICVATNHQDAIKALRKAKVAESVSGKTHTSQADVAFMFPGQGNQYLHMGADLYRQESVFHEVVDFCCNTILNEFGVDLHALIYPPADYDQQQAAEKLTLTQYAQPAIFVIEYATAKLLESWGIKAQAYIGHSIGEYVAAALAEVFTLEEALKLVVRRGQIMQSATTGSMVAIPLSVDQLHKRMGDELSIAVISEPNMCVVSGPTEQLNNFIQNCEQDRINCFRLHTSHAFHSVMMDEILDDFSRVINSVILSAPKVPFISNVSGNWITDQQAIDPQYWVDHIRQTVQFNDGIEALLALPSRVLYEVGPGNSLTSLVQRHPDRKTTQPVFSTMRHPNESRDDLEVLLQSIGLTWQHGVEIDWVMFNQHERHYKVPLPVYPFERKSYWIQPTAAIGDSQKAISESTVYEKIDDINQWFYAPSWQRQPAVTDAYLSQINDPDSNALQNGGIKNWLLFIDNNGLYKSLIPLLQNQGGRVICVKRGENFQQSSTDNNSQLNYTLSDSEEDLTMLMQSLHAQSLDITGVIYLWLYDAFQEGSFLSLQEDLQQSFYTPLFMVKALNGYLDLQQKGNSNKKTVMHLWFVSTEVQLISGNEAISAVKSPVLGLSKVCAQEMPYIQTHSIDFDIFDVVDKRDEINRHAEHVWAEIILSECANSEIETAYRGGYRWIKSVTEIPAIHAVTKQFDTYQNSGVLKHKGVYLITGGFGGIGRALAEFLAQDFQADIILLSRSDLPDRQCWEEWLGGHDETNSVTRKIKFILSLEAKGSKVNAISADVANYEEMKQVVQNVTTDQGEINGVIHCAGVAGGGLIQLKDKQSAATVINPKINGALVLDDLFDSKSLDFMVLCSSLVSITGGLGQVDYTAANIFLDALAQQRQQKGQYTVSINWDTWAEAGMAVDTPVPAEFEHHKQRNLEAGIRSQEGVEVFKRVLSQKSPQIIISTRKDLQRGAETAGADQSPLKDNVATKVKGSEQTGTLPVSDRAPVNSTEAVLSSIWQEMFGIEQIGVDESFFDLGGHSLLAVQIISRISDTVGSSISLNEFFDASTIAGLASIIDQNNTTHPDDQKIESTDALVDALSDDEVARLLAEKGGAS